MTTITIDRAVVEQALEALEWHYRQGHSNTLGGLRLKIDEKALRNLRAALAQEQDEPVAWLQPKTVDGYSRPDLGYETCSKDDYGAFPVYRAPPKAEPVQMHPSQFAELIKGKETMIGVPVYWSEWPSKEVP